MDAASGWCVARFERFGIIEIIHDMTRLMFALTSAIALGTVASAQERLPNQGSPGTLRSWPMTGSWAVGLVRLADGALGCVLITGYRNQSSGEQYIWGIRWRPENVAATITDNNQLAVNGPAIQIVIDTVPVGTYQIDNRLNNTGFYNVTAELSPQDKDKILILRTIATAWGGASKFDP